MLPKTQLLKEIGYPLVDKLKQETLANPPWLTRLAIDDEVREKFHELHVQGKNALKKLEEKKLTRVYFPVVPAAGEGALGWVRVTPRDDDQTRIEVAGLEDSAGAKSKVEEIAKLVGASGCDIELKAPAGTHGDSWGYAVGVALHCFAQKIDLLPYAYTGVVKEGSITAVTRVPAKQALVKKELPGARGLKTPKDQRLLTLLGVHFGPPAWMANYEPNEAQSEWRPMGGRLIELRGKGPMLTAEDEFEGIPEMRWAPPGQPMRGSYAKAEQHKIIDALKSSPVVLEGQKGVGKSSLARCVADAWALKGPVVFLSQNRTASPSVDAPDDWLVFDDKPVRPSRNVTWESLVSAFNRASPACRPLLVFECDHWPGPTADLPELLCKQDCALLITKQVTAKGEQVTAKGERVAAKGEVLDAVYTRFQLRPKDNDSRYLPFISALARNLGIEFAPAVIVLERALNKYEVRDRHMSWSLHRVASALVNDGMPDQAAWANWDAQWAKDWPQASSNIRACWEELGILESQPVSSDNEQDDSSGAEEALDWTHPMWGDALKLWWLRNKVASKTNDDWGWVAELELDDLDLEKVAPTWSQSPKHQLEMITNYVADALPRWTDEDQPEDYDFYNNEAGDMVIEEGVSRRHVVGLRVNEKLSCVQIRYRGAGRKWCAWENVKDVTSVVIELLLRLNLWWTDSGPPPCAIAHAVGWMYGYTKCPDPLLDNPPSYGVQDALQGFQAGAALAENPFPLTFRWFVHETHDFEPVSLAKELAEEGQNSLFWLDVDRALDDWLDGWRWAGLMDDFSEELHVPHTRVGFDEGGYREDGDFIVVDPALYSPLRSLGRCLAQPDRDKHFDGRTAMVLEDILCRLCFNVPRLPGHFMYLRELLAVAMAEGGLQTLPVDQGGPSLDDWMAFLDGRAQHTTTLEMSWFVAGFSGQHHPQSSGNGVAVNHWTTRLLSNLLGMLPEHELKQLLIRIAGPVQPVLMTNELSTEHHAEARDHWNERVAAAGLIGEDERADTVMNLDMEWWTPETLLALFEGDPIAGVLSRLDYRRLCKLAGIDWRESGRPDPRIAEDALAVVLRRFTHFRFRGILNDATPNA